MAQQTDGTILEFLAGSHSYDGVWFGDLHPTLKGKFWWRPILREYFKEQIIKAFIASDDEPIDSQLYRDLSIADAKEYFNETYGK